MANGETNNLALLQLWMFYKGLPEEKLTWIKKCLANTETNNLVLIKLWAFCGALVRGKGSWEVFRQRRLERQQKQPGRKTVGFKNNKRSI